MSLETMSTQVESATRSDHPQGRTSLSLCDIKQSLLARRTNLLSIGCTAERVIGASGSTVEDMGDVAQNEQGTGIAMELMGNVQETVAKIDAALRDIKNGTFGLCAECDDTIPAARIKGLKYLVRTCVKCQTDLEKTQ